ncbi:MAG: glycosyltransferase [Gammaproteobacteria bacterium]|nr:glycosyltransferase [Gammaproteobacteria bacterium]
MSTLDASTLEANPLASAAPIVLAAYQCAPGQGSVSQIGWEWYHRLARRRPVLLVTHVRNREHIEASADKPPHADILYIDSEWFAGPLFRLARKLFPRSEHGVFLVASIDFFLFDWLALQALRRRLRVAKRPSLVHVVTPVTLAAPSALHRLGLPLIRGPLNCGLESPKGFDRQLRDESTWVIRLRALPRLLDGLIGATRHAKLLLTATRATRRALPPRHRAKTRMMLENGVALEHFPAAPWPPASGEAEAPLRVLFVGRMIALKGVDMLLEAVARLQHRGIPVELICVGDGPARDDWTRLTRELSLTGRVRFSGALAREEVQREMAACHVFCLPSVRESGGAVLLEAMATARPVLALDHGGPAELVDDEVGRLIPLQSVAQVISDLERTLAEVAAAPDTWTERGQRGRARVERLYAWESKLDAAEALYDQFGLSSRPARVGSVDDAASNGRVEGFGDRQPGDPCRHLAAADVTTTHRDRTQGSSRSS